MAKFSSVFANINKVLPAEFVQFKSDKKLLDMPLEKMHFNYYMSDVISKNSPTMLKCTKARSAVGEEEIA